MHSPSTHDDMLAHYRALVATHTGTLHRHTTRRTRLLQALAAVAIAIVFLTLRSTHAVASSWPLLVAIVGFLALIPPLLRVQTHATRQQRLLLFYDRALARAEGATPAENLHTGEDLRPAHHLYEHDLDLLGPNSLFALLATVRTGLGQAGLARFLLDPVSHEESTARQQAVRELAPRTDLREHIALLGTSTFQQIPAAFFHEWLEDPAPDFPAACRPILLLTAAASLVLLLAGLLHLRPWSFVFPNLALALAFQGAIAGYLRPRVLPLLKGTARLQDSIRLLTEGLALLEASSFTSPRLLALQVQSSRPEQAVQLLKKLDKDLTVVEQRTKEYFFLFSLLLAAGTQAAISIARWKRRHAPAMRLWLDAWAEFEALNALATYAFEHPADAHPADGPGSPYTWPDLLPPTHPPTFEALALAHPLLPGAIPNNVSLGGSVGLQPHEPTLPQERGFSPGLSPEAPQIPAHFFLISGSNMSGKSTLLRSVGINAVLAYAGAPVRAQSLRLTPLALGASLALTDSLAEGKSKFRAEVERLAAIVAQARQTPTLFLVDEIFSGTNSADRRTAAAAVLRALLEARAIGALSTHDLALTDLVTQANGGQNVHMASPNPEDPLAFDYLLKPGVNTSSNALAIVRMLGLDA